jgi:hypothetical protein
MEIDLEKIFDCINSDVLMVRVARRVTCKRLLGITNRYRKSGIMIFAVS